ncbi:hypothetical protein SISNIDRAFT_230047 [Sistotremastrum niveocremeum HHB9708]|uniref:Uncharacterized protein n=1 Tax=Sistotremastrum niveocremeum HHB9708 TaxID=1314777 RepID=A0A164Q6W3_9AGAM|nr:hypothetical protein SISNIDRAFT_230047 [Sistotremastrum niveocremeum HHB9708]
MSADSHGQLDETPKSSSRFSTFRMLGRLAQPSTSRDRPPLPPPKDSLYSKANASTPSLSLRRSASPHPDSDSISPSPTHLSPTTANSHPRTGGLLSKFSSIGKKSNRNALSSPSTSTSANRTPSGGSSGGASANESIHSSEDGQIIEGDGDDGISAPWNFQACTSNPYSTIVQLMSCSSFISTISTWMMCFQASPHLGLRLSQSVGTLKTRSLPCTSDGLEYLTSQPDPTLFNRLLDQILFVQHGRIREDRSKL